MKGVPDAEGASAPVSSGEVGTPLDGGADVADGSIDVNPLVDAGIPYDLRRPDGTAALDDAVVLPDMGAGELRPTRSRVVVLRQTKGEYQAWVAWIAARKLWARPVRSVAPVVSEDAGLEDAGGQEARIVADLSGIFDDLAGAWPPGTNRTPWVFVPDGPGGSVRAYDISTAGNEPIALDLYPPLRVSGPDLAGGDKILLVGWSQPVGIEGRVVRTLVFDDGSVDEPIDDGQGLPGPSSVVGCFRAWILAFDVGLCGVVEPNPADMPGGHWWCGAAPDAQLVGRDQRLFFVGPRGDEGVAMWSATSKVAWPAAEPSPEAPDASLDAPDVSSESPDASSEPPDASSESIDAGIVTPDASPAAPDASAVTPDASPETPFESTGWTWLAEGGIVTADDFAPVSDGVTLIIRTNEGEAVWLVTPEETFRVAINEANGLGDLDPGAVLGVSRKTNLEGSRSWLAVWDEQSQQVQLRPVALESGPNPVELGLSVDSSSDFRPENCKSEDRNRNGVNLDGTCCTDAGAMVDFLFESDTLETPVLAARTNHGDLFAFVAGGSVHLTMDTTPIGEEDFVSAAASWPDFHEVEAFDALGGTHVILARPTVPANEEAYARALWAWPDPTSGDMVQGETSTPCAPALDVALVEPQRVRFYCPDGYNDVVDVRAYVDNPESQPDSVPYPIGSGVKWMVRHRKGAGEVEILVAMGDAYDLRLWREAPEPSEDPESSGGPVLTPSPEDEPPDLLEQLSTPEARMEPIHLPVAEGGRVTRTVGGGQLQVLVPALGWAPVAGSLWPVAAVISSDMSVAFTTGLLEDPATQSDSEIEPELGFYVHDLGPGGDWWGRRVKFSKTLRSTKFLGLSMAASDESPQIFIIGKKADPESVQFEGFSTECTPAL